MKKTAILRLVFLVVPSIGFTQKSNPSSFFPTESKIIYGICFTHHGGALGVADNRSIKIYSTEVPKLLHEFKNGHTREILTLDISEDSLLMVSGGRDSAIAIWDFHHDNPIKLLRHQKGIVTSVKISPDRKYLASGGTDHKVFVYDLVKNEVVGEFSDHTDDITVVKFSNDGSMLASASGDKTIHIYDLHELKFITSLRGHRDWVRDISFTQDGKRLVSCGDDASLLTWDITNVNKIRLQNETRISFSWVLCLDNYWDNRIYAFGDVNGLVRIEGSLVGYHTRLGVPIQRILFKPDAGHFLQVAVATRGKGVLLIKAETMKLRETQTW